MVPSSLPQQSKTKGFRTHFNIENNTGTVLIRNIRLSVYHFLSSLSFRFPFRHICRNLSSPFFTVTPHHTTPSQLTQQNTRKNYHTTSTLPTWRTSNQRPHHDGNKTSNQCGRSVGRSVTVNIFRHPSHNNRHVSMNKIGMPMKYNELTKNHDTPTTYQPSNQP